MSDTNNRIVVVLVISNLEYGGAQRQIVELINNMDSNAFDVHLVSLSDYVPLADTIKQREKRLHIIHKKSRFDLKVAWKLSQLLEQLRADIVHGYLFDAEIAVRLAGRLADTPLIVGSERNTNYSLKKVQRAAYTLTHYMLDLCIANSHAGAKFNRKTLNQPEEKYRVVHNGVDAERFAPLDASALREELGLNPDTFYVGMFGSYKRQKNHPLFFKAVARILESHPDTRFILIGDQLAHGLHGSSDYKQEVSELVDQLGVREYCHFVGNRDDVEMLYNVCDITVLPSLYEGTPNVALESMACGVPVVATDVSDNSYVIPDDQAGYVVPLGDEALLAERVTRCIDDPNLLQRLKQGARDWVLSEFSTRRLAEKTEAIYREALATKRGWPAGADPIRPR